MKVEPAASDTVPVFSGKFGTLLIKCSIVPCSLSSPSVERSRSAKFKLSTPSDEQVLPAALKYDNRLRPTEDKKSTGDTFWKKSTLKAIKAKSTFGKWKRQEDIFFFDLFIKMKG